MVVASQDSRLTSGRSDCFPDNIGGCYAPSGIVPDATMGRATNTVILGAKGTSVRFAWVDPALTQVPPWMAE
jgi:hypothetical protein